MHKGSCLCGAVRFTVEGTLPAPTACHCTKCRKHTGHFEAGTDVARSAVTIRGAENLTWYFSSEKVRRGFCSTCGSSMFFDPVHRDRIGIAMGAFDGPTGARLERHIFVADKGDYYDIADGLPQNQQWPCLDSKRHARCWRATIAVIRALPNRMWRDHWGGQWSRHQPGGGPAEIVGIA